MFHRLLFSVLVLFAVCSFSFFLIHIVPGDPVDLILGDKASVEDKRRITQQLSLDQSLITQYGLFLKKLIAGDLGRSVYSKKTVVDELWRALPATIILALVAFFWAGVWGIGAGIFCVHKQGSWDMLLSVFSLICLSVPVFFSAPFFIWLFAVKWQLLPVSGMGENVVENSFFFHWDFRHIILPAMSLSLPLGGVLLKISRASLWEVWHLDYIRTAHAKGVSPKNIYLIHAFKNAVIPIVTVLGLQLSALLTGTVIVESIFDWPGLGLLLLESIQKRDYPVVQGVVLLIAVIYVLINLITDSLYQILQPKFKTS